MFASNFIRKYWRIMNSNSIVVKNQFTNQNYSKYGSTPANFVTSYTARDDATLTVYPVVDNNHLGLILPFDSSSKLAKSIETLEKNVERLNPIWDTSWSKTSSLEGRAFDSKSLSISSERLVEKAARVQEAFDNGHTVHKMVVSFDTDYLIEQGIIDKDKFRISHSLKPVVDEMRLRSAVAQACQKLSDDVGYVDPEYIGSIQLDRDHAHAHIVACETSPNTDAKLWYDGKEFGTFSQYQMDQFKSTIDLQLTLSKDLQFLPSDQHLTFEEAFKEYESVYAQMNLRKNLMLASISTPDPELEQDLERVQFEALNNASQDISNRKGLDQHTVRQNIEKSIEVSDKVDTEISPLLALQLFDINSLKGKSHKKSAQFVSKVKESQKKNTEQSKKFDQSYSAYQFFKSLYAGLDTGDQLKLSNDLLPYYSLELQKSAYELDANQLIMFVPVNDPSKEDVEKLNQLKDRFQHSTSKLEHAVLKEELLTDSVEWFKRGHLTAFDLSNIITSSESSTPIIVDNLPSLKPSGTFSEDYVEELEDLEDSFDQAYINYVTVRAQQAFDEFKEKVDQHTIVLTPNEKVRFDELLIKLKEPESTIEESNVDSLESMTKNKVERLIPDRFVGVSYENTDDLIEHSLNMA